ncbi:MAG: 4-hydroxy-tetrahydrodipicolinate reductase [Caulobacteraceae bacterium]|nr:4-hydroxy-tetrahydrodipicolinate reductase [Caulobacteraceae bacterium]
MTGKASIGIGVAGALGRMGRAVAAVVKADDRAALSARFDRPELAGHLDEGEVLQGLVDAIAASDVIIDFSAPAASLALARAAAAAGDTALVIGSTGFSKAELEELADYAAQIPIVRSGNFSLGVNVLMGLVTQAAAILGPKDWDIEIFEAHHRRKIDAPSGTALMLGEAAAEGRGADLSAVSVRGRDGVTGPRPEGVIGFSVMRGGGIVGEHSVTFAAEDEIITLSHSARDRGLFARGAVAAAVWAAGKPAGLYDMMDVLGFRRG